MLTRDQRPIQPTWWEPALAAAPTLPIYIPSRSRWSQVSQGYAFTTNSLDQQVLAQTALVVPEEQYTAYQSAVDRLAEERRYQILSCPAEGIAETRRWIGEYAQRQGQPKFLMLDDDLRFYIRPTIEAFYLYDTTPEETRTMIRAVECLLDVYEHVSISAREGNNRYTQLRTENTRTLRALAYQTTAFLACAHGRVPVMEDFDVNLQILERGGRNCCYAGFAQGQRATQMPGGCSDYRTLERHEAAARELAALHPQVVRLRTKKNKTNVGGFGERTEVTIYWKKAASLCPPQ